MNEGKRMRPQFEELVRKREVAYTYQDPDSGEITIIAVERLMRDPDMLALEIFLIPVLSEIAAQFRDERGIEQHRLARITADDLDKYPMMIATWYDGSHLTLDGHHRYVKAHILGRQDTQARIIPETIWGRYVVEGAPKIDVDTLCNSFSGIL
jgi:hypothetical protein